MAVVINKIESPRICDNFVSPQFNIIGIVVLAVSIRQQRHTFFQWCISALAPGLVCYSTLQRILQSQEDHTAQPRAEYYIMQSLLAWVSCVIMDITQAVGLLVMAYKEAGSVRKLFRACLEGGRRKVMEQIGTAISCASMLMFAVDVYTDFYKLTSDRTVYLWFFLACFSKISRIIVQGLILAGYAPHLVAKKGFASQIEFSSIFLLMQVFLLAQFASSYFRLSLLLTVLDVLFRAYQCVIIPYHCCYYRKPDDKEVADDQETSDQEKIDQEVNDQEMIDKEVNGQEMIDQEVNDQEMDMIDNKVNDQDMNNRKMNDQEMINQEIIEEMIYEEMINMIDQEMIYQEMIYQHIIMINQEMNDDQEVNDQEMNEIELLHHRVAINFNHQQETSHDQHMTRVYVANGRLLQHNEKVLYYLYYIFPDITEQETPTHNSNQPILSENGAEILKEVVISFICEAPEPSETAYPSLLIWTLEGNKIYL